MPDSRSDTGPRRKSSARPEQFSLGDPLDVSSHDNQLGQTRPQQQKPDHKRAKSFSSDPQTIIGNAFSFFRGRPDPNESRYASDEEEQLGDENMPFSGENEQEDDLDGPLSHRNKEGEDQQFQEPPPAVHQLSALKLPSFFGRSNGQDSNGQQKQGELVEDGKNNSKPRKFLPFFRKKTTKDKERRHDGAPEEEVDLAVLDEDAEARERAVGLINSLSLGSPAINLLASCLCEDEYGIARAPLLLNLLGIQVTDVSVSPLTKNRKFKIDLEYGVLQQRLKWSVEKNAKDLLYLHSRFKLLVLRGTFKSEELPRYPLPPLLKRAERKTAKWNPRLKPVAEQKNIPLLAERLNSNVVLPSHNRDQDDNASINSNGSFRDRLLTLRAHLSSVSSASSLDASSPEEMRNRMLSNQNYVNEITKYLTDLSQTCAMKPQLNRLFHFFEISPISALLSYETGYTGKQGVIHIGGTAKSQGWRVGHFKANDLKGMIDRRSEKWFLIRSTYLMYVSDINSTTPLEVFLIDLSFKIHFKGDNDKSDARGSDTESEIDEDYLTRRINADEKKVQHVQNKVFKHLRIILENNERKLVMIPKSQKEHKLWVMSLNKMVAGNPWAEQHRFDSFAPVRKNCFAQWFVDARDYFWAISSALEMAKDTIFIHDWWLSPELYLRRPANGNQQFRIDRLLQRKAQQGVKIFVIVYRNVGTTVPIDSLYTKHSILSLNQENIHVIRSPNQLLQNTYFWAHHEKVCIIDYTVAFMGGIDLCYGRYDTPDHVLADDSHVDFDGLDAETLTKDEFTKFRVFPGKDYSNTRVKDFNNLDKPYESMYDRNIVPRMPWHDVHMVTSGEAARDLSRHFVQRWNYLLRQKRPSRLTPLLTPPPDLTPEEVAGLGLDGTCEIQVIRSAGNWSLGLKEHEESIHQAYLKLIEESEHFVYIENQFFVTSCFIDGTEIKNRIGDALVDRIIRAHKEGTVWKAVIIIPLVPGFESQVDKPDGSSVRVVMQCEYMSISRGLSSLFAKLRKYGIDPDDYIQFFSLRKWGAIGPDRSLVTEQLYIHAKTMIVDDRVAIIGSANINERSMRGVRDSEVAAVVRDSETIKSTMNGQPYAVGRFPHTLRLRLMREHLGVSVDILDVIERKFDRYEAFAKTEDGIKAATNVFQKRENLELSAAVELAARVVLNQPEGTDRWRHHCKLNDIPPEVFTAPEDLRSQIPAPESKATPLSFNNRTGPHEANKGIREKKKHSYDTRVQQSNEHKTDVYGEGVDKYRSNLGRKARLDSSRFLKELAQQVMGTQPSEAFLPHKENVLLFLELDDHEFLDNMDEFTEDVLASRNKERLLLLKKIAYLQHMATKANQQAQAESVKRVAAGLSAYPSGEIGLGKPSLRSSGEQSKSGSSHSNGTFNGNGHTNGHSNGVSNGHLVGNRQSKSNGYGRPSDGENVPDENVVSSVEIAPAELGERKSTEGLEPGEGAPDPEDMDRNFPETTENGHIEGLTESIPIVSLDEQQLKEQLRLVQLVGVENPAKFIDPYGFEDPLDPDFYEDIWFETARKNTDLFRLVFHCQPDDFVSNWKEYKQFMKLGDAFKLAQAEEARNRREKFRFDSQSTFEGDTAQETPRPLRRNSQTINLATYQSGGGILGDIPNSDSQSTLGNGSSKPTKKKFRAGDVIPEDDDAESETEDGYEAEDNEDEENYADAEDQTEDTTREETPESTTNSVRDSNGEGSGPQARIPKAHHLKAKRRAGTFSARRKAHTGERIFDRDSSQRLLEEISGHLVLFPVDWLLRELEGGNWFFNTDRIPPIEIYD